MVAVGIAIATAGVIVGAVGSTGLSNAMIEVVEFISGALFSIWLYSEDKISKQILSIILIGILIVDLWVINNEFLSLKSSKSMGNQFIQTQDINFIKTKN